MAFWKIERSSDGFIAVIEADTQSEAVRRFEEEYGSDFYIDESSAAEHAEFQRDAANNTPWYS